MPKLSLDTVTPEYALWTFVHNVDRVFSRETILKGKSFVSDLRELEPAAVAQVFDFVVELESLQETMAICETPENMKAVFNQASPGSQRLMMLKLARFLELLQALPKDQNIVFPAEPTDMLRYFLIGDWESRKSLTTIP